jgi:threonine dehydratase
MTNGKMAIRCVFLKMECYQPTRVFKVRGAANKMLRLGGTNLGRGVVAASSGNHGIAVAYVAHALQTPATIVVPTSAVIEKVAAMKELDANVVEHGLTHSDRFSRALQIQKQTGAVLVPPFDDAEVIAGQGTIGLEIVEDLPDVETILVPVGGGGLIAGISLAVKSLNVDAQLYGVQSEKVPSMHVSIQNGKPVRLHDTRTVADGLAAEEPGQITFRMTQQYVKKTLLVSEERILESTRLSIELLHLLIEPSAASVIAALGDGYHPRKGENVVLVISGSNISLDLLREMLRGE